MSIRAPTAIHIIPFTWKRIAMAPYQIIAEQSAVSVMWMGTYLNSGGIGQWHLTSIIVHLTTKFSTPMIGGFSFIPEEEIHRTTILPPVIRCKITQSHLIIRTDVITGVKNEIKIIQMLLVSIRQLRGLSASNRCIGPCYNPWFEFFPSMKIKWRWKISGSILTVGCLHSLQTTNNNKALTPYIHPGFSWLLGESDWPMSVAPASDLWHNVVIFS